MGINKIYLFVPDLTPYQIKPTQTLAKTWPVIKLMAYLNPKLIVLNTKAITSKNIIKGTYTAGVPAGKKTANKYNLWLINPII